MCERDEAKPSLLSLFSPSPSFRSLFLFFLFVSLPQTNKVGAVFLDVHARWPSPLHVRLELSWLGTFKRPRPLFLSCAGVVVSNPFHFYLIPFFFFFNFLFYPERSNARSPLMSLKSGRDQTNERNIKKQKKKKKMKKKAIHSPLTTFTFLVYIKTHSRR